ncbi:chromosome segregation protein SMC [Desulfotomaculum sp. 1211_IL3151]|uniref:chromosome segregation protein SMC n=1 Tax=Desulfotomaculum sp. 1211_IL3151 TaxID=3084055 RepID=UPI002FDAC515
MGLKRLDIQGFKSFGDRVKLEFDRGLSVVVGPNGSGKSNISDAISWCLGEQRVSSLRGGRMEDVIFAGSYKRKPIGMAEVTLTLDNTAKMFSLPYEEVSVTRRLYRSGESEYLINKVPCRLKDIHALFMDTGLGRGAYSLIGQGKVDEILSSRPEERRSIIEEAAGIVKYRHRKEEALRKLAVAQQDLNRVSDIINELAGRLEPLAQQAAKAREYKVLSDQASALALSLYRRDWEDLTTKAEDLKSQLTKLKEDYKDERPAMEKELEMAKSELHKIEIEINALKEKFLGLVSSIDRLNNKNDLITEQINHNKLEQQRVEKEVQESTDLLQRLNQEWTEEKVKIKEIKECMHVQGKNDYDYLLEEIDQNLLSKQELFQNLNTDLIEQLNKVANQRNLQSQANDRRGQLAHRLEHLKKVLEDAQEKEQALGLLIEDYRKKTEKLNLARQQVEQDHHGSEEELHRLQEVLSQLQAKLATAKEEMVAKHSRLKVLEESLHSHSGFMKPVRELLKATNQKNDGSLGICGAVADLIKVPQGFETAMEAALGGALQNLVTESSRQAKEAIEYLKRHNLGRATFLPLDSLRPTPAGDWEKRALGLPGVIGLAANLIKTEGKYRQVVELLLGRLVVVDTLSNAIEVARQMQQRIRIVTLTGELFNPGGSLTGGGAVRNAGGMLHTRRERDELAKVVQVLHQKVNDLAREFTEQQQLQQQGLERNKDLQQKLVILGLDVQAAAMDLSKTREELSRTNERRQESHYQMHNIEQEMEHWSQSEREASTKRSLLEGELTQLQGEINRTQESLAKARNQKAELESKVNQEKVRQAELHQEMLGIQKIIKRLEKEMDERRTTITASQELLQGLCKRNAELAQQQAQVTLDQKSLQEEHRKAKANLKLAQASQETAASMVEEQEKILRAKQELWLQTSQKVHSLELQQARIQTELELLSERLKEHAIDDPAQMTVLPAANKKQVRSELQLLKSSMAEMGPVNERAETEYQEVVTRYNFLEEQRVDLEESRNSLDQLIDELNRLMSSQFETAFKIINQNFARIFEQLFGGGGASMNLTEGDTLSCGIEITAQPPGKKNQSLSLLSGGERALTAIALLFAILKFKPSPFCVLDEIEASLDEANVHRFAEYLCRTSDEVQFIVISHRKGTMEKADALYGVTMDETGVTKLLSMSLDEAKGKKKLA